jgi:hypothetical protein
MNLLILGLLASGAAQGGEPAWREFHTVSDGRPGFEQVFSYDPASVRRRRHAVRVRLLSRQPIVEGEPVVIGRWRAEVDCAERRGVALHGVHGARRGWAGQFGDQKESIEAALVRALCR